MGQFKFILWLADWYLQTESFEFEWDQGNSIKSLKKHGVSTEEVESIFELKLAVPIGSQISPPIDEERFCVIGPSLEGCMISVVFTLRGEKVRAISARLANKKERRIYEEIRKALKNI